MAEIDTIKAILSKKGMQPGETYVWREMRYFWADQLHPETEKVFAKYLLLPLSLSEWNAFHSAEEQFSADVVGETYYTLHSDLCWNLYLICVLSDEDFALTDRHTRFEFESNTEYTRKLVLKESELGSRLPVGHTLFHPSGQPLVQPEQEWRKELGGEYEFCLEEFNGTWFKEIASGIMPKEKAVSDIISAPAEKITSIQSIHIPEGFRPHFYNKDVNLSFPKANLLSGANGAGKTSVFSAIELAMTGTVRKQQPDPDDPAEQADVSLVLRADGEALEIHKAVTPQEKKRREAKWYKNRAENRRQEQLNVLFHRFNYFSVDDTYLFANEQPDHDDIFSKLLYGPKTAEKWKNIETWREKCGQKVSQLGALNVQLALSRKTLPAKTVDERSLRSYITQSGLRIASDASYLDLAEIAAKIQAELNQVAAYKPILSRAELEDIQRKTSQRYAAAREKAKELQRQSDEYTAVAEALKREIEQKNGYLKRTQQRITDLSKSKELLPELEFVAAHQGQLNALLELQREYGEREMAYTQLQNFWSLYHELQDCTAVPDVKSRQAELEDQEKKLRARLDDIEQEIIAAKTAVNQKKQLISQLHSIGRQLAQQTPSLHQCPLCGTENIGASDILRHLNAEHDISSLDLSRLYQERLELYGKLAQLESQREELRAQSETADKIADAYKDAERRFPNFLTDDPLGTIKRILTEKQFQEIRFHEVETSLQIAKEQLSKQWQDVKGLLTVENRARSILLRNNYPECGSLAGQELLEQVQDINNRLMVQMETLKREIYDLEIQRPAFPSEQGLRQEDLRQAMLRLEQDSKRWERLLKFWENVSQWVPEEAGNMDGAALQAHCEKLRSDVEKITAYSERQQEYDRISDEMEQNRQQRDAYQAVVERLEELQNPKDRARVFIQQNIEQISRIFLSLHLPQEFSGLAIEDEKLVGLRGDEKVPVVNMSTGQRTALVLSVFFQLHLSNSAAPEFLLIDEPVANIDELNVLSLMDFLRELVISHGRQVFFTTANRNVAQLFRRKFSFLGEDFQRLDFSRKSVDDLEITRKTYNQEKILTERELS